MLINTLYNNWNTGKSGAFSGALVAAKADRIAVDDADNLNRNCTSTKTKGSHIKAGGLGGSQDVYVTSEIDSDAADLLANNLYVFKPCTLW